jgi:hypothetical protein
VEGALQQDATGLLAYPLDGPWNVRLPASRIASIVSSMVNNFVVLYALMRRGLLLDNHFIRFPNHLRRQHMREFAELLPQIAAGLACGQVGCRLP